LRDTKTTAAHVEKVLVFAQIPLCTSRRKDLLL
jgi:hypothetical protein